MVEYNRREVKCIDAAVNTMVQLERQKCEVIFHKVRVYNASSEVARCNSMVQVERQKCEVVLRKERVHNASKVVRCKCDDIVSTFVPFSSSRIFYCLHLSPLVKK